MESVYGDHTRPPFSAVSGRKRSYSVVYDTEIYDRNTEPCNTAIYDDLRSFTIVLARPGLLERAGSDSSFPSLLMLSFSLSPWIIRINIELEDFL